jgi:anti-anti-sigma factor
MTILHRVLEKDLHLLKLNRPLNGHQAKELEQAFSDAFSCGARRVVVDLEDVPFVDGQGLAALVTGYKLFGHNNQNFRLAALQEQPTLLLELTMFNRIFHVFDNVAAAVLLKPSQRRNGALAARSAASL